MDVRIIIKNGVNCLVYDEIVNAKDENKALQKLLEKVTISADDTIEIKEA